MSCHGGGGGGGEGALSRQGSVYSLTLNEVESHLGEPLRSMNLDDLLRTAVADFSTFPSCVDFLKAFLTQKLEPVMQIVPQPEPKQQLRRTTSASF
ncbi:hypothetical protein OsJ_25633 [Oryza sativa Japonica Group]|uniref:Uncharacterized protein n=1 Tax=Oryza sativa subsp. japonica TaxID=39947 RepID=A3BNJ9_ORYSJ|nr:hypothetical protein OsJ_25633 [Oryza sativa Japonica Group]